MDRRSDLNFFKMFLINFNFKKITSPKTISNDEGSWNGCIMESMKCCSFKMINRIMTKAGIKSVGIGEKRLPSPFLKSIREYTDHHPDELFLPKIFRDISPSLKAAARECMESSLSVGKA
jgi:hypothetical protein